MKPSVYIETTIVSYLTCWPSRNILRLAHEMFTRDWWAKSRGNFELYASQFVIDEASGGDPSAAAERLKSLEGIRTLPITNDVSLLGALLRERLSLPPQSFTDALHVAICAVNGVSFLLTWNCRHLANGALTQRINDACDAKGFQAPQIVTPLMLMDVS